MNSIGLFIVELRNEKGMSQQELAEKMGVSEETVNDWEKDKVLPTLDQAKALSELFDLPLKEFVYGKRGPNNLTSEEMAEKYYSSKIKTKALKKTYMKAGIGILLMFLAIGIFTLLS